MINKMTIAKIKFHKHNDKIRNLNYNLKIIVMLESAFKHQLILNSNHLEELIGNLGIQN